jgi:hypothetical protein
MRLAKLIISIIFVISSSCFSYAPYPTITAQTEALNDNDDYTIVREFHDDLWWLVYYNEDGMKVMEVPDPWQ